MEQAPQAQTVQVRVQVVDIQSRTLDLIVPTYLPARDLTQRVARDAGLEAYWADGRRRLYWLRARGRLLGDDERLMDLGVVPHELIHLLPEPPAGSGVVERPPDYPETRGYIGKGTLAVLASVGAMVLWAVGWALALSVERNLAVVMLPGFGLGLLCCSLARHIFGGEGWQARVAIVGILLALLMVALSFVGPIAVGENPGQVYAESVPGLIMALIGVLFAWLAWWGAVEPLPDKQALAEAAPEVAAMVQCGVCGLDVEPEVRMDCPYNCGRHFHTGCHQARVAVYRGDPKQCAICGVQVQA